AGDGQRDRNGHHVPRLAKTASTISRSCRAAFSGLETSDKAEITATPSAPAAITSAALLASMPALPPPGKSGARARSAAMIRAHPAGPIGAFLCCLDEVA